MKDVFNGEFHLRLSDIITNIANQQSSVKDDESIKNGAGNYNNR